MPDTNDRFIWIDIETGGLDPNEVPILEVGFRVTDIELNLLGERDWQVWEDEWDDFQFDGFITKMHLKSGLFDDCTNAGLNRDTVSQDMTAWLKEWGISKSDPMCGSSVQFDRGFMGVHFPLVHDLFSYRNIDISTVKELCRRLNPVLYGNIEQNTTKRELHRALPDLEDTCSEAAYYFENFLFLGD